MEVLTRAEFRERFGTATERRVELQERFDKWFSFDTSNLPLDLREWLDHELCRELHEMDVFLCKEDTPEFVLDLILSTFGQDRTGQESIVEIIV